MCVCWSRLTKDNRTVMQRPCGVEQSLSLLMHYPFDMASRRDTRVQQNHSRNSRNLKALEFVPWAPEQSITHSHEGEHTIPKNPEISNAKTRIRQPSLQHPSCRRTNSSRSSFTGCLRHCTCGIHGVNIPGISGTHVCVGVDGQQILEQRCRGRVV